MNSSDQLYINHEVRLQLLEEAVKDNKEMRKEIHNNFKWTIAIILGSVLLPTILHGVKLI